MCWTQIKFAGDQESVKMHCSDDRLHQLSEAKVIFFSVEYYS